MEQRARTRSPVRQAKPGSRGKGETDVTLKLEIGAQRVRIPPGQSLASGPVASLAWSRGNPGCEA